MTSHPSLADNEEEELEVLDEASLTVQSPIVDNCARRGIVHSEGLLHKAVHCFVFDSNQRLLLQQRSHRKRIGAGLWDVSLAEHVSPGESFAEACRRGLSEELGISCYLTEKSQLHGPLTAPFRRRYEQPGFIDNEIVQGFMVLGYSGALDVCEAEVEAVEWRPFTTVLEDIELSPDRYTPWLREHLGHAYTVLSNALKCSAPSVKEQPAGNVHNVVARYKHVAILVSNRDAT